MSEQTVTGRAPFGVRLHEAMGRFGPLCVGIDPHAALLKAWGLPDTPAGLETFAMTCVEALGGHVAAVKPQSAFFERFGSAGVAVLERTLAGLRDAGTLSILDVKRGDIGSTMGGYAQAYLTDDAPLRADAITVSPYLGYGSLRPALDVAAVSGRGVFVLALTSNPEGASVQHAVTPDNVLARLAPDAEPVGLGWPGTGGGPVSVGGGGRPRSVAAAIVEAAGVDNAAAASQGVLGSVGLVVGATTGDALAQLGIDVAAANAPLLVPGVGAQGGTARDVREVFGDARHNVLVNTGRSVLSAGPSVAELQERAVAAAAQLRETLGAA